MHIHTCFGVFFCIGQVGNCKYSHSILLLTLDLYSCFDSDLPFSKLGNILLSVIGNGDHTLLFQVFQCRALISALYGGRALDLPSRQNLM